jgi:hypothetical protein
VTLTGVPPAISAAWRVARQFLQQVHQAAGAAARADDADADPVVGALNGRTGES